MEIARLDPDQAHDPEKWQLWFRIVDLTTTWDKHYKKSAQWTKGVILT